MRDRMANENNLKCYTCGEFFSHRRSLNRHITDVHRNRSYSCDICGKEYSHRDNLNTHRRMWHDQERERPRDRCQEGQRDVSRGRQREVTRKRQRDVSRKRQRDVSRERQRDVARERKYKEGLSRHCTKEVEPTNVTLTTPASSGIDAIEIRVSPSTQGAVDAVAEPKGRGGGLSGGAITGIVIGSLFGISCCYYCCCKGDKKKPPDNVQITTQTRIEGPLESGAMIRVEDEDNIPTAIAVHPDPGQPDLPPPSYDDIAQYSSYGGLGPEGAYPPPASVPSYPSAPSSSMPYPPPTGASVTYHFPPGDSGAVPSAPPPYPDS
ncbi:uncharacterized protein LOC105443566 [Strongylocentrotus purpuratus]|uniref:C2H2-type domain-containing protein n=2 Tax=Strongylocentrotus purpuratus TaxID=7668 RepID=A0A7M7HK99_STRPU|nr:uncharacterized protein LOC105443566 [Strongylocentrotus purpuratus]